MRKLLSLLFAAMLAGQAWAEVYFYDFSSVCESGQTLYYKIIEDGTVGVTSPCGYNTSSNDFYFGKEKPTGDVIIPTIVNYNEVTYQVTSICDHPFYNCAITSVTIPNSVTSIGAESFELSNLTSIVIPESVTSIGDHAFYGCRNLTSIVIPEAVTTIGEMVFSACRNLTSIVIPESVTTIGRGAFGGCSSLTSIVIPESVTTIGREAFVGCENLSVIIPNSVTIIGANAFHNVKAIAYKGRASGKPWGASEVYTTYDEDGFIYGDTWKTNLIGYAGSAQSITIPESVTKISANAFSGCSNLTVKIPNKIRNIGQNAFLNVKTIIYAGNATGSPWGARNVGIASDEEGFIYADAEETELVGYIGNATSLTIPNSVISIAEGTFSGCSQLESITLPFVGDRPHESTDTYQYPFGYIFGTENYEGGASTEQYYYGSSTDNTTNTTYYIPSSLKSVTITGSNYIPYGAFNNCKHLTSITIPNSVTNIAEGAFSGCSSLESITLPFVGDKPHEPTDNYRYTFGYIFGTKSYDGGSKTSQYYFNANSSTMVEYYIPSSLRTVTLTSGSLIPNYAFNQCQDLTSITIADGTTSIGACAFRSCNGMTSIAIPDGVTSIGPCAFLDCNSLISATIPNSVTYLGVSVFGGCISLTDVTLPDGIASIPNGAFNNCLSLTSIPIPNSVTNIGDNAFFDCRILTSITIPSSVNSIGSDVFTRCFSLTEINVENDNANFSSEDGVLFNKDKTILICCPAGRTGAYTIPIYVTNIGKQAFDGCNLTSVTISENVKTIGNSAFNWCRNLTSITIPEGVTSIGDGAFYLCENLTSITIPEGVTSIGDWAFYMCENLTSITIPTSVTSIGCDTFWECSSLASVTIPNSVTSIGADAFYDCTRLTSVTIPNSVTSIGDFAFGDCRGLTSVTIPNSVKRIDNDAFYNCNKATFYCEAESKPENWESSWTNRSSDYIKWSCKILNLEVNNTEHGSATAAGYAVKAADGSMWYLNNAQVTLTASPNEGCHVIWEDNSTDNVRTFNATESKTCTATLEEHSEDAIGAVAATCTETGLTEGKRCPTCGVVLVAQEETPALQHNFSAPTYAWSEDGSACTATAVCQRDANHKETEDATITDEETIAATCEEMGTTTYTATFTNSRFSKQTKDVVDIVALGHNFGAPTYTWSEDGSTCTATAVCQRDANHKETEDATITNEETIAATCEEMGTTTYTATFANSRFSKQTKDVVDIAALGHNFGAPTYVWSEDGSTCTATAVCQRDANHKETEDATITNEETIAATCEDMGTTTYTASFTINRFSKQTKDVVDIAAKGHTAAKAVAKNYKAPTCTAVGSVDSVVYCTVCQAEISRTKKEIAATGHTEVVDAVVAPTCTEAGKTEGKHCSVCNTVLVAQEEVAALGHTEVTDAAIAATCTEAGKTEGKHCSVCNAVLVAQKETAATGHTEVVVAAVAATCTEAGKTEGKHCSVCNAVLVAQEEIAALGHTEVVDAAVAATCTEAGKTEGKHCSVCNTVLVAQKGIAATGHTEVVDATVAATCTEAGKTEGKHCSVCNAVLVAQQEIAALGHTEVVDTAVAATCTEAGLTEGKHCSICSTVIVKQDTVPAKGHTIVIDPLVEPTCTETGLGEGKHCAVCDEFLWTQELLPPLGHEFKTYVFNNDATTEADGTETALCEHGCGAKDTRTAEGTKIVKTPEDGGVAIGDEAANTLNIYAHHNIIVVENAADEIRVYDATGRLICKDIAHNAFTEFRMNTTGIFIVKTGNTTKRVAIMD